MIRYLIPKCAKAAREEVKSYVAAKLVNIDPRLPEETRLSVAERLSQWRARLMLAVD